jgi:hypothetical protein
MGRSIPEAVISRPVGFRVGGEVGALVCGGGGVGGGVGGGGVGLAALLNKPPPLRKLVSGEGLDLLMAEMDDSEEMVTSTLSASNAKSSRADDQETTDAMIFFEIRNKGFERDSQDSVASFPQGSINNIEPHQYHCIEVA